MTRVISVRPVAFGWSLRIDAQEAIVYAKGAQAENAARGIAQRLVEAGQSCEILIYLRDGSLGGRLHATPRAPAANPRTDARHAVEPAAFA